MSCIKVYTKFTNEPKLLRGSAPFISGVRTIIEEKLNGKDVIPRYIFIHGYFVIVVADISCIFYEIEGEKIP